MQKHTLKKIALGYALGLLSIAALAYAATCVPTPAVGLYWLLSGDPTIAPGVSAPLNQLGIRKIDAPVDLLQIRRGHDCMDRARRGWRRGRWIIRLGIGG